MTKTALTRSKLQSTLPAFSKVVVSSLFFGVLSSFFAPVNAQITPISNVKEALAVSYLTTVNQSQQFFYLENTYFASTISELSLGVPLGHSYTYEIDPLSTFTDNVCTFAKPIEAGLNAFISCDFVTVVNDEPLIVAGICKSIQPGFKPGTMTVSENGSIQCSEGYQLLQ
jgi:hypothetical protein